MSDQLQCDRTDHAFARDNSHIPAIFLMQQQ